MPDGEGSGGVVIPDAYKLDMGKRFAYWRYAEIFVDRLDVRIPGSIINAQQPVIFVGTDQDVYLMNAASV
ncbi:MAG: hypothetical protein ACLU4J_00215 [Butyricimonas paravirosa]